MASPVGLSKYEFGLALARRFAYEEGLVKKTKAEDIAYVAPRAPDLTLNVEKIRGALDVELPDVHSGIDQLYKLQQQGYRDQLKAMAIGQPA